MMKACFTPFGYSLLCIVGISKLNENVRHCLSMGDQCEGGLKVLSCDVKRDTGFNLPTAVIFECLCNPSQSNTHQMPVMMHL